jgi:hypothetical protein
MRCTAGVRRLAGAFAFVCTLLAAGATAHEIPADAAVQAFVKPAVSELQVLIRVPMAAMREVEIPRRGPGYLDLARSGPALEEAARLWLADNLDVFEGERKLPYPRIAEARVSLPSDRSFASYEAARAHLAAPALPQDTELYWSQGLLDVLLVYPIESERSDFSVDPRLERLAQRTVLSLRFLPPGGELRAFELTGNPGLVRLDPRWHQAALRFVEAGFLHILDGTDHLLFILCLVIPFRRLRALVLIVTSFTVAHSITLIGSAFGLAPGGLWFPPLVETLIAASILYMALENIVGSTPERRWVIAFGFGLVHGFGFSFALRETLQFAGSHLLTSLLAFNVGVELGQVLVLALMVPALSLLFRFVPEKAGSIILSALVAHTAWHWMLERGERLRQFAMPAFDAAALAQAMRVMLMLVVLGVLGWLLRATWTRWKASEDKPGDR